MIYRIGICDDEQLTCSELENYINEIFECKDDKAEIYDLGFDERKWRAWNR